MRAVSYPPQQQPADQEMQSLLPLAIVTGSPRYIQKQPDMQSCSSVACLQVSTQHLASKV